MLDGTPKWNTDEIQKNRTQSELVVYSIQSIRSSEKKPAFVAKIKFLVLIETGTVKFTVAFYEYRFGPFFALVSLLQCESNNSPIFIVATLFIDIFGTHV